MILMLKAGNGSSLIQIRVLRGSVFFHEILNFYKKIKTLFSDDHIGPSVPSSDKKEV